MRSNASARRPQAHRARAGFTMIEVLLAVMLFALAFTVLAAAYVNVLNAIENTKEDRTLEQEIAMVRNQVELESDLEVIEAGGEVPTMTHGMATWNAKVTPSETVADLFRVDLEIELAGDDDRITARKLTQTLYLLRSQWSDPAEREVLRQKTRERLDELRRTRPL